MAEQKPPPSTPPKGRPDGRTWLLFIFPALLAAIGAWFALNREPAPAANALQAAPLTESSAAP